MKYTLWILAGYATLIMPMEQPQSHNPLSVYISPRRNDALNAIRAEFKISDTKWTLFTSILARLHEITSQTTDATHQALASWQKTQETICQNALLHQSITPEENGLYLAVLHAFVRRKMAPPFLRLELFEAAGQSMQTTEEVRYKKTVAGRSQIDQLSANLAHLTRHITIQVNLRELRRFSSPFIALAAEHEIGHYSHIDCVTSSLLQDLISQQEPNDENILKSISWKKLEELMEKEADDFMIDGDSKRIALREKYMITPGHWNFNLELLLLEACYHNKESAVQQLILDGVMINSHDGDMRDTALHKVAHTGNTNIAQLLLCAGANSEVTNSSHETPLHIACMNGHTGLVALLLKTHRANPHAKKEGGITPLMLAAHQGHIAIIELLLNAGANLHARADNSWRAYHFARNNKKSEACKRLQAEESGLSGVWARLRD